MVILWAMRMCYIISRQAFFERLLAVIPDSATAHNVLKTQRDFVSNTTSVRDAMAEQGGAESKAVIFAYMQQLVNDDKKFTKFAAETPNPFERLRLWAATLPDGSDKRRRALQSADFALNMLSTGFLYDRISLDPVRLALITYNHHACLAFLDFLLLQLLLVPCSTITSATMDCNTHVWRKDVSVRV